VCQVPHRGFFSMKEPGCRGLAGAGFLSAGMSADYGSQCSDPGEGRQPRLPTLIQPAIRMGVPRKPGAVQSLFS